MIFAKDGAVFEGAQAVSTTMGFSLPTSYTGPRDEYLAGRTSAWLGVTLNMTPVYLITGRDAAKFLTQTCMNRDFSLMQPGMSKHALICNEAGHLIADGVIMKEEGDCFRTYWMAPCIQYYLMKSGLDVQGEYVQDEYFFQIDGPKSLEILEEATRTDLHDIKFARNKTVKICGTDMVVHRLGMSGCLAYEVHGKAEHGEMVYRKLREVLEAYGGKPQGQWNYGILNHTVAGYPNQMQHYLYPYAEGDEERGQFMRENWMYMGVYGSSAACIEDCYVTPYDIGWGYLVNFDHSFIGKEALLKIRDAQPRKAVTLEWNADDVADVFASNFRGRAVEAYVPIEAPSDGDLVHMRLRGDKVVADGKKIGITTGRVWAYYEKRMVSLAFIDPAYAQEGREVCVLWGDVGHPVKEIRAKVAAFPYYHEEYRNETFDVEKIPHRTFAK